MPIETRTGILDPFMPTDHLAQIMWVGCLQWAIDEPGIVEQFQKQTGMHWTPPRDGLEAMIDKACGVEREFVLAFVRWFNQNIWGEVDGRGINGDEEVEGEAK